MVRMSLQACCSSLALNHQWCLVTLKQNKMQGIFINVILLVLHVKKSVILYSQIQNLKVGTFHASDYEQYEIVLYTRWNKTVISYNYKCYEKLSQIS